MDRAASVRNLVAFRGEPVAPQPQDLPAAHRGDFIAYAVLEEGEEIGFIHDSLGQRLTRVLDASVVSCASPAQRPANLPRPTTSQDTPTGAHPQKGKSERRTTLFSEAEAFTLAAGHQWQVGQRSRLCLGCMLGVFANDARMACCNSQQS